MLLATLLLSPLAGLHASFGAPVTAVLYATSTGLSLTTLLAAALLMSSPASANYVPNYICSWKPTPGSPELGGYEYFCNAPKRKISSTYAEYRCSDHHEFVADLGALDLNRGILRFRAPCPTQRNDGWGRTDWDTCYSTSWGYCTSPAGKNDHGFEWRVPWHRRCFDSTALMPSPFLLFVRLRLDLPAIGLTKKMIARGRWCTTLSTPPQTSFKCGVNVIKWRG